MNNLEIFCVTHLPLSFLDTLGYNIAGAGNTKFPSNYLPCNTGDNIVDKEKYYSEYVFHYWFWKNKLKNYNNNTWIGFCQRRRFWLQTNAGSTPVNAEDLNKIILKKIPKEWSDHESIIQPPTNLKEKKMVMIKRGYKSLLKDPTILFNQSKQTIKLHFDMHHGHGNLDKAIDLMNDNDREDFRLYVNSSTDFSANNMFISKKEFIDKWFQSVFSWLFSCEKVFGFKNLKGYETTRIYAYLAERYLSFWFKKYTNYIYWPWTFTDLK
jgi:hypothetical protein